MYFLYSFFIALILYSMERDEYLESKDPGDKPNFLTFIIAYFGWPLHVLVIIISLVDKNEN